MDRMCQAVFALLWVAMIAFGAVQAQALGTAREIKSDLSGAINGVSRVPGNSINPAAGSVPQSGLQTNSVSRPVKGFIIPMTFELSGTVEEFSPGSLQINIDGRTLDIGENVKVFNLVDKEAVTPIEVGSMVGFETNQLAGGKTEIVRLWVLSAPR